MNKMKNLIKRLMKFNKKFLYQSKNYKTKIWMKKIKI